MAYPDPSNLFLNVETLDFLFVSQYPSKANPYLDIEFTDDEPCAQAMLTYDFEAKAWNSCIMTSEGPDEALDMDHNSTPEQHATLLQGLPPRLLQLQQEAEALFMETGSFEGLKKLSREDIFGAEIEPTAATCGM